MNQERLIETETPRPQFTGLQAGEVTKTLVEEIAAMMGELRQRRAEMDAIAEWIVASGLEPALDAWLAARGGGNKQARPDVPSP